MPSTFLGLNTAYLGLSAANASLNTTANNISNIDTEGYSRQHTVQQADEAMRFFTSFGCVGAGVEVLAVERYRNEYYDARYWDNNSVKGEYETKQYYMKQIENYFLDEPDQNQEGFSTIFSNVYSSLQELIKMTGSAETRIQYIGSAKDLTEYFRSMYDSLQNVQKDVNSEIKVQIDQINSLAQKIATLNKQINVIEVGGGHANALRDERANLIDKLSEIIDVECEEQKLVDQNNFERETGATRYVIKVAGGQVLVDDTNFENLVCTARAIDQKVNQCDVEGLYDIRWSNGNYFSMHSTEIGGKLQGLIEMRDGNNGEYFHGTVSGVQKVQYDTDGINGVDVDEWGKPIYYNAISITVEEEYLKDMNKSTLPTEGGQITVGGAILDYESWKMDYDGQNDTYTYTFILDDNNDQRSMMNMNGQEVGIGFRINYQGVPYYMEQMNEWLRLYAQKNNEILTNVNGVDNYGNTGDILFTANEAPNSINNKYNQWTFQDDYVEGVTSTYMYDEAGNRILKKDFKDASGKKMNYTVTNKSNSYYNMTCGNVDVNKKMIEDCNYLATHSGNADEESKQDLAQKMFDLRTDKKAMNFRGASAGEFLQCILSDVSLNAQRANNFTDMYTNIGDAIENQRLSVSGVDQDEEAVNLVKFQNAYNLASKMIQVLTEVYDKLINQTGV